tara:strand:- start:1143 stop:1847 length:705 start_codon:yes stop_codon:yes gene_type:complete
MQKHALITGTSKGIGLAMAQTLLKNNFVVQGYSRSNKIKHTNFKFHKTDLSQISKLEKFIFPRFDNPEKIFLINNAGDIGNIKSLGYKKNEDIINEININLTAPTLLCNKFINTYNHCNCELVIINISSGAALRPIHSWGTYCQSKAGIDMLTNILNEEHPNIRTLSIYPGVVDTDMQEKIRNTNINEFPLRQMFVEYFKNNELTDPNEVAQKIFYIMSNLMKINKNLISVRDF